MVLLAEKSAKNSPSGLASTLSSSSDDDLLLFAGAACAATSRSMGSISTMVDEGPLLLREAGVASAPMSSVDSTDPFSDIFDTFDVVLKNKRGVESVLSDF
jgi:hypothetical protein